MKMVRMDFFLPKDMKARLETGNDNTGETAASRVRRYIQEGFDREDKNERKARALISSNQR